MNPRIAGALLLLALGAAACRRDSTEPTGPRLTVRWTGPDTADFTARAVGEWCDSLRLLEIRAVAGDTGVGIALYPPDTLEIGDYPVRRPDVADTARPPSAALALRWFTQTAVMGYQGDSGGLTLERRPDGTLAGRFTAAARPLVGKGRLHLTGSFDGLRPATAPRECAGAAVPDSARADTTEGDEDEPDTTD